MQKHLTSSITNKITKSATAFVLSAVLCLGANPVLAQETSLNAPEVLDLDDPFSRGINRAADQASDGLNLPQPGGQTIGAARIGKDLLGESKRRALSVDLFRVAALAVTEGSAKGQIFEASNQDVVAGSRPQIPYLRIGSFDNSAQARQAAINLKSIIDQYIGGHFILRNTSLGIDLDMGPMHSVQHAENYCEILLQYSNGIVSDCYAVLEYPGYEPLDTFLSSAMLRVSTDAIETVIDDESLFDLQASSRKLLQVQEGEMLGTGVDQIVKITPTAVVLVSDEGDILQLPLDYISEQTYRPQPQATQGTNNQNPLAPTPLN